MGFSCGIVGLPNVGKSTLFNALTATAAAAAENFPFCTIEPNAGRVPVPDPRLAEVARVAGSARTMPAQMDFTDIAGLVRGASRGEGLGNQFLAHIREAAAILHVVRCFSGEVTHVEGSVDPVRDAEVINTELLLADIATISRAKDGIVRRAKSGDKALKAQLDALEAAEAALDAGTPARALDGAPTLRALGLITAKPVLYVCNVDEASAATGNAWSQEVAAMAAQEGAQAIALSAAAEAEIALLLPEERGAFLGDLGLAEPGLARVIRAGYALLGLQTFFTAGPKEARAWTIRAGATAPEAAGAIHTDFQRGFIRAEVVAYADFVALGGEAAAREAGKLRSEGAAYVMADGDVTHFRFNV
ncbi:MAG TPA: redox-regulated ATPase YchF [Rhodospirillaceae bacterium]|jgi:GTP-binding protein YchF|nr:redox-regulated ATPase YchF [Alphaproteobacteria bacterium]HBH26199.1 redox-regulated ATPase YchF [Rhodospirillaceae bacterium]